MARIKIEDLPKDMKISKEEMKKVVGGALITYTGIESDLTQTSPTQTTNTTFEDFDQKTNQLYNLLSTVMKAKKEAELGITRNFL